MTRRRWRKPTRAEREREWIALYLHGLGLDQESVALAAQTPPEQLPKVLRRARLRALLKVSRPVRGIYHKLEGRAADYYLATAAVPRKG